MMDTDGTVTSHKGAPSIAQSRSANPAKYLRIWNFLNRLGYSYTETLSGFRLDGGQAWRFTTECRPVLTRKWSAFQTTKIRGEVSVVSVEDLGVTGEVVTLTLDTGCYNAAGFLVKNCDTKDSWFPGLGTVTPIGAVIDRLQEVGCLPHVVITGGNPMMQSKALKNLLAAAFFRDKHITIETNAYATWDGGDYVDLWMAHLGGLLWSLSPKLHQLQEMTIHQYLMKPRSIREAIQVKVVVQSVAEVKEAGDLFRSLGGNSRRFSAILQPEWSSMRKLTKDPGFLKAVAEFPVPVRVLTQSHKTLAVI